ncbi:Uncharacterised protein [Mycobacteroides abscessus subsp. abscessus]|nr:Uncharacterised protein [Mycobacteroides abscessus subsp. abscessus]
MLAGELLRSLVVVGVQLTSPEGAGARHERDERFVPRPRGIDQPVDGKFAHRGVDREASPGRPHRAHVNRPAHIEGVPVLVFAEVPGHGGGGPDGPHLVERQPGQLVDAVGVIQRQRRPAELPGPARAGRVIQDDEPVAGRIGGLSPAQRLQTAPA